MFYFHANKVGRKLESNNWRLPTGAKEEAEVGARSRSRMAFLGRGASSAASWVLGLRGFLKNLLRR